MKLNIKLLFWFLLTVHLCWASFITPNEISSVEDRFEYGDTEYIMLNVRVTWNEALIICQAYSNGSLAIVSDPDVRDFLAEALSETNLEMEDLWVGARIDVTKGHFVWITGDIYEPDQNFIRRGKEHFNTTRDCLAFARRFHSGPHFINLECVLRRAFICEKPYENTNNGSITTPDWIDGGEFYYGIFFDKKTWKQSVRECRRKYNAHLASFTMMDSVQIVGKYLLVGRPSLENAWIGGFYTNGHWRFLYNGVALPEQTNNKTLFPPWRKDRPLKKSGCLLLDRHLALLPVFLEARCERKRSYICAKKFRDVPDNNTIIINNHSFIIFYRKETWEDAVDKCESIGAVLVKVTKEIIHDITYIMGENVTEIDHIWIGGRLDSLKSTFYWIEDKEIILPNNIGINHYPPWYDNIYSSDYACLNMDRENHNRPMFYGAACETPQAFICEQKNLTLLRSQGWKNIKEITIPQSPSAPASKL